MSNMAHLHLHSSASILDSTSKVSDIVKRVSQYGHKACSLTEHGNISSAPEFYKECKQAGIKPILAEEFYMVEDHEADKTKAKEEGRRSSRNHHLIIMAMNDEGWTNIKKLNTRGNEKFYY